MEFKTVTGARSRQKMMTVIMCAIAVAVLPVALFNTNLVLLLEGGVVFVGLMLISTAGKAKFTVYLKPGAMVLTDSGIYNTYRYEKLSKSDFVFTQSASQAKRNTGTLKVNGCPYTLSDIESFNEAKRFVEENY